MHLYVYFMLTKLNHYVLSDLLTRGVWDELKTKELSKLNNSSRFYLMPLLLLKRNFFK